jgi:D-amino-acid dehydrogenase
MPDGSVVVVGAGVIGAASAYYLAQAGYSVTMVDRNTFGGECSHANCGFICPSHAMPLCVPDALLKTLRSVFTINSPFRVNALGGPSLWGWLIRFALNCTEAKALAAARARHALLQSSKTLLRNMIEEEDLACEWHQRGLLIVHARAESAEHHRGLNDYLSKHFNLRAEFFDSRQLVDFEPALKEGLAGGWYYEGDAHLRPDRFMAGLRGILVRRGVRIVENAAVSGIRVESGAAVAVATTDGDIACDHLVLAAGAATPALARKLGFRLHLQPGKGYSLTTDHPDPCPRVPMILENHAVAVTPFDSGFRLGSTMEIGNRSVEIRRNRLALLESGAGHYLRDVRGQTVQEEWVGLRPMSDTGVPVIGRVPAVANAYIAAGHSMVGMSTSAGTGKLLAELVSGDDPHIDPGPYRVR